MRKIWHAILDFIAWLTQDNARLRIARLQKSKHEMEIHRMRFRLWR
jgi:hypothetical protein